MDDDPLAPNDLFVLDDAPLTPDVPLRTAPARAVRQAIERTLVDRFGVVDQELAARLLAQDDLPTLELWHLAALRAASLLEFWTAIRTCA